MYSVNKLMIDPNTIEMVPNMGQPNIAHTNHTVWQVRFKSKLAEKRRSGVSRLTYFAEIGHEPSFREAMSNMFLDATAYESVTSLQEFASEYGYDLSDPATEVMYNYCEYLSENLRIGLTDSVFESVAYGRKVEIA